MSVVALLALITISEATIGVFVKLVGDAIPIYALNFYALAFAAAFLGAAMRLATGRPVRFPKNNLRDTLILGALIALQISVFNYAMTRAPIANVVIFWSVAPFFVFLFSTLFLAEPARKSYVAVFLVALAGIFLARPLEGGYAFGNLVALADGAIYAAMVVYLRYEGKSEASNDIFWSMATAAVLLSPALVLAGPGELMRSESADTIGVQLPAIAWAAGLGIVSTGFAYFGISIVLKSINANVYSLVDIIVSPVVAALLGYLVFREMPSHNMIYGGVLLLGSGFWLTRKLSEGGEAKAVHPCQCA